MSKRKQVTFTDNENDLLQHALKQQNFGDYVKALIKADKENGVLEVTTNSKKKNIYQIYNEKCAKPHLSKTVKG